VVSNFVVFIAAVVVGIVLVLLLPSFAEHHIAYQTSLILSRRCISLHMILPLRDRSLSRP
jgi:uncharacterized membrane protein